MQDRALTRVIGNAKTIMRVNSSNISFCLFILHTISTVIE